ncbi:MAG TPA: hypothetical protein PLL18_13325, partial [Flavobacteriales bacterium]|nr:hypothetical protein [Flavobacteriales bacterium]
ENQLITPGRPRSRKGLFLLAAAMACVTGALGQPQLEWQVSSAPAVKPVGYSTTFTGWEAASPYRAQ